MRVVSTTEMREELREASVLVAPLSFKNCSAEEVRTVFSTKLLTYFIIGRPVLVYGPADCYHIQSALKSGWGFTVDRDDTDFLADSLRLLANDIMLQKKLVAGVFEEAERRRASKVADDLHQWVMGDTVSRD
jgi:glycosyltransferase involved in cell wall biosynthesis